MPVNHLQKQVEQDRPEGLRRTGWAIPPVVLRAEPRRRSPRDTGLKPATRPQPQLSRAQVRYPEAKVCLGDRNATLSAKQR